MMMNFVFLSCRHMENRFLIRNNMGLRTTQSLILGSFKPIWQRHLSDRLEFMEGLSSDVNKYFILFFCVALVMGRFKHVSIRISHI